MKVGIIGLGLMGGSFSMDIKNIYKQSKIFGLVSSKSNYQMSMKLKLIDGKLDDNNISDMDVVLISVPVDETVKILPDVLNKIGNKTLVIDVGSTKNLICKSVSDHKNRKQFLATHPIAGTENSGPNASVSGLYFGVTNILCEIEKTENRLNKIYGHLISEIDSFQVEKKIKGRVKRQMEKTQKEYYLNEQMKAIQKELGENDDVDEIAEIENKIKELKLGKEASDKCKAELKKLKNMSPMSAEATVIRNYLDWVLSIPWNKPNTISKNLKKDLIAACFLFSVAFEFLDIEEK